MKLVVIIPAYNEEKSVGGIIQEIPRSIKGVSEVKVFVMNDGSNDDTAQRSKDAGADVVFSHPANRGLGPTFKYGLEQALRHGADIIVNIDADGQYNPQEIPKLIGSILSQRAGMVIGDRQIRKLQHLKIGNKYGNILGSFVIRFLTGCPVSDASSGFRALSRETALRLNIYFDHTYTHQTIVEAVYKNIHIEQVPVEFRAREHGQSRLIKNIFTHIRSSLFIIVRTILVYKPLKTFLIAGSLIFALGFILGLRFLYFYLFISGQGKVQSLVLAAILVLFGTVTIVLGFIADLIAVNRKVQDEILYQLKRTTYNEKK